jgi:3-dehydro-L-gulonate 2-dehydrogenase
MVKKGFVKPGEEAMPNNQYPITNGQWPKSNVEQWDGRLGPGPINAIKCTDRAIELAKNFGIGCVGLAKTNHWMRGGTYGWRAAKAGCVFIGWSNTTANTPAWGAVNHKLGNNPMVIAVPYGDEAIVLDMAMTQFSYGALEMYSLKKEHLPVYGGFDTNGKLTTDPSEIIKSQRILPTGYWKGSGLSLLLDILAAVLSGGLSVADITKDDPERNVSQVFIAIDLKRFGEHHSITKTIHAIIEDFKSSVPEIPGRTVRYPGENVVKTRAENIAQGIPVSRKIWNEITSL